MENPFHRPAVNQEEAADRRARRLASVWKALSIMETGGVSAFFGYEAELAQQGLVMEVGPDGKDRIYTATEQPISQ